MAVGDLAELPKVELIDRVSALQARLRGNSARMREAAAAVQEKLIVAGTGYALGAVVADAQANGVESFSIMGLTTEQSITAIATAVELLVDDTEIQRVARGVSNGGLAVVTYQAAQERRGGAAAGGAGGGTNPAGT